RDPPFLGEEPDRPRARDVCAGIPTRAERALPLRVVLGALASRAFLPQRAERILRARLSPHCLRGVRSDARILDRRADAGRALELYLHLRRTGSRRERDGDVVHRDQSLPERTHRDERPARQYALRHGAIRARATAPAIRLSRRASPLSHGQRTSRTRRARRPPPALRRPLPDDVARARAPTAVREAEDPRRSRHLDRPADTRAF